VQRAWRRGERRMRILVKEEGGEQKKGGKETSAGLLSLAALLLENPARRGHHAGRPGRVSATSPSTNQMPPSPPSRTPGPLASAPSRSASLAHHVLSLLLISARLPCPVVPALPPRLQACVPVRHSAMCTAEAPPVPSEPPTAPTHPSWLGHAKTTRARFRRPPRQPRRPLPVPGCGPVNLLRMGVAPSWEGKARSPPWNGKARSPPCPPPHPSQEGRSGRQA